MISLISSLRARPQAALALLVFTFTACASAGTPGPSSQPARPEVVVPPPPPPVQPTPSPAERITEAPRNWHLLDETSDRVPGIASERAVRELLAGMQPKRTVVVAVIDSGVDTAHVDLAANLWSNPKETAGNGRDDDGNGLVDDVHGWNYIGGPDGENVNYDTFEVTRLHAHCTNAAASADTLPAVREQCARIAEEYAEKKGEVEQTLQQIRRIDVALRQVIPILEQALGTDTLTVQSVTALQSSRNDVQRARQIYLQLAANGITQEEIDEAHEAFGTQLKYGLDLTYNPRTIVGDRYGDTTERHYGNRDVMGPHAKHGTHVAGIIGALRGNEGVDGIAPAVQLMIIRAVPDGDERDKDVANAIRYAADHGAHIINMSFGKAYSPYKTIVDDAVKDADSRGVLMIHAAGNDGENLAETRNYPNPLYEDGGRAVNWIEVGATSWKSADSLVAPFSNYGREQVDVFAPGVEILSTAPGGGYERESGTSMAAPVVSGLAALIMAYYPDLEAAEVKRIIVESATKRSEQMVLRPGAGGERVPFGSLSATGGIVNAYAALRMAAQMN
jgi:subtilisin family serine protease